MFEHDGIHSNELDISLLSDSEKSLEQVYGCKPFDLDEFKKELSEISITTEESLLKVASNSNNIIGIGGNGVVCKIPGIVGYVMKVPNGRFLDNQPKLSQLVAIEDSFPDMNLGQAVATIGVATILKEQAGIPSGVPYGEVRKNVEVGNIVYETTLGITAEMPQSSYDQLAKLFQFLNKKGLNCDPSKANNILIDKEKSSFNVVDLNMSPDGVGKNDLTGMVIVLMDNAYAWRIKDVNVNSKLTKLRDQILTKCIEAVKKTDIPLPSLDDSSLAYSFELAGRKGEWKKVRGELNLPTNSLDKTNEVSSQTQGQPGGI